MRNIFVNLEVKVEEYWRILDVCISSRDYSSINARMPENVDDIRHSAFLREFTVSTLSKKARICERV